MISPLLGRASTSPETGIAPGPILIRNESSLSGEIGFRSVGKCLKGRLALCSDEAHSYARTLAGAISFPEASESGYYQESGNGAALDELSAGEYLRLIDSVPPFGSCQSNDLLGRAFPRRARMPRGGAQ
nr:hypothetical protein [uncultured bacterium]